MDENARSEIREFLAEKLEDYGLELPPDITLEQFELAFGKYLMSDFWDWVGENAKSFFSRISDEGWDWLRKG